MATISSLLNHGLLWGKNAALFRDLALLCVTKRLVLFPWGLTENSIFQKRYRSMNKVATQRLEIYQIADYYDVITPKRPATMWCCT